MDTLPADEDESRKIKWIKMMFSGTLVLFYVTMIIVVLFIILFAFNYY